MNSDIEIKWTDDCFGKKDYDANLIKISSRYWPRGGSHLVFNEGGLISDGNSPERRGIKPAACSSLLFGGIELEEKWFDGDTPEEVFKMVEEWADEKIKQLETIMQREFPNWKEF